MAADVVGYSRLMEADEEGTRARLRSLQAVLIDPQIATDRGRIVKTMGDGILAEYPSAVDAVRSALAIQQALRQRNAALPEASRMAFRVGINVGDVIVEGDDIHGDGVNVAARLEGICEPGAVYVSGAVHDQAAGKLAAAFEDLGEQTVKNIARPLRVYRVSEQAEGEALPPTRVTPSGVATPSAALPLPAKPSIAVLPFDNMSDDPEQEFFADGIVEDIITTLSKVPLLFVVSRNSTFVYKGKAVDIKQVAAEQGVRYVLEGSVRRAGDRVRITAQLIDASDGRHIWADRYDGRLDDVFGLQDTITQAIVGAMEVRLTEGEQARVWRSRAGDPLVYEHMLRGRAFYEQFTRRTHLQARQEFEAAARLNADYATSYVYIAYTHLDAARWGWSEEPARSIAAAFDCIDRALAVDPDEPDAVACRSYTHLLNGD